MSRKAANSTSYFMLMPAVLCDAVLLIVVCMLDCSVNFLSCTASALADDPAKPTHAVLMAVSWGVLLPVGVVIAKFYRAMEPRTGPKAWWFVRHQAFQYAGVLLSIAGFIAGIYYKRTAAAHFVSVHAKLGLAVMIGGMLQPLNAFIRPKPGAPYRTIWSLAHKSIGYGAVLLTVPTIFYGMRLYAFPNANAVASAYLGGCVIVVVLFLVMLRYPPLRAPAAASAIASKLPPAPPPRSSPETGMELVATGNHAVTGGVLHNTIYAHAK